MMANIEQQIEFFDIKCPCIGVCQSGPKGYCKGCLRSREERQFWFQLDNNTKHKISQACFRRKQSLLRRKQASANDQKTEEQLTFAQDLEQSLEPTQSEFDFDSKIDDASREIPLKIKVKKGQIDLF